MSDIILVGLSPALEKRIRGAASERNGALESWEGPAEGIEAAEALAAEHPLLVVLGSQIRGESKKPDGKKPDGKKPDSKKADPFEQESAEKALDLAGHLEAVDPSITTLLFGEADADGLRKAMAAGVREVLPPSAKMNAIKKALARALDAGRRLREGGAEEAGSQPTNRFIVVVSAKGGAGKTVVSSNLSVGLAKHGHRRSVLVDLDLQFGDVSTALLLSPTYSAVDAVEAAKKGLDPATLKVFLTTHGPSDLHVLAAPEDPAVGESLSVAALGDILDLLAAEFGYVVVDTDPGLSEWTLMALERATDVVIVADLDVPSVRGTRKLVEALDVIGMNNARRHLVLNRANSKVGLSPSEVQEAVGLKIDVALPSTRDVPVSMNEGRPVALNAPNSPFGKRMMELAERFLPARVKGGRR